MTINDFQLLASAGGKWGKLGLWDIKDTESAENGVYLFEPHSRPINWQSWDRYIQLNLSVYLSILSLVKL